MDPWNGMRLRELRAKAGLSRQDLADKAGVSFGSLQGYELDGVVPPFPVGVALAAALEVPPAALLEPPSPDFVPPKPGRPRKPRG